MSLRAKMLLLLAGVVLGAALASMGAVRFAAEARFRTFVSAGDTGRGEELARMLAAFHDLRGSWDGVQELFGEMGPAGRPGMGGMMRDTRRGGPDRPGFPMAGARSRVVLVDLDGTVVADSGRELLGTHRDALAPGAAGIPVAGRGGTVGTLFVGTMLEPGLAASDADFLRSVTRAMVAATVLAAAAALAAGLFAIRRLTKPVAELTRAAERAGAGNLDVQVTVHGADEIARLAETFNRMTRTLRDQEEGRRRMIADSAHELGTPVSLIQGTVEAMLDGVFPPDRPTLEGLHEETLRLSRLVEDLNELSLLESGTLALDIEAADLAEIARSEAGRFAARAAEQGVAIAVEAAAGLPRRGRGSPAHRPGDREPARQRAPPHAPRRRHRGAPRCAGRWPAPAGRRRLRSRHPRGRAGEGVRALLPGGRGSSGCRRRARAGPGDRRRHRQGARRHDERRRVGDPGRGQGRHGAARPTRLDAAVPAPL